MTSRRFAAWLGALASIVAIVAVCGALARAQTKGPVFPEPTGHVVDAAGLLREDTRQRLEAVCRELREKTGAEIAVALVPSIAPLTVDEYAVQLFQRWGVGRKKEADGVLLVVARDERRVRVEVGYGLEGLLPDGRVGGILRSEVVPRLRENDWDGGVRAGVETLASIIARDRGVVLTALGERPDTVGSAPNEAPRIPAAWIAVPIFLFFFLMVNAIQARRGRRWGRLGRRRPWGGWYWGSGGFGGGGWGGGGFGGGGGGGFGGFGGGSSGGGGASSGF